MKQLACLLLAFLIITLTSLFSAPRQQAHAQPCSLRIVCDNFPPWKYKDPDGSFQGIDVTLVQELSNQLNLETQYLDVTFRRGLKLMQFGEADIMTSLFKRPEREEYLIYIEPPYLEYSRMAFYVLRGDEGTITKYDDLSTLKIGVMNGVKYFPQFDTDTHLTKIQVDTFTQGVQQLLAHNIDALINSEMEGDYMLTRGQTNLFVVKAPFLHREPQKLYITLSKESPFVDRLEDFTKALHSIVSKGGIDRLKFEFLEQAREKKYPVKTP